MTAEQVLGHPSFMREVTRLRKIGGEVEIVGATVTLIAKIVPLDIVEVFAERMKRCDIANKLDIVVKTV